MSEETPPKTPSKLWYIAHVFFWVITGLICYILWKDDNRQAAKAHLVHSIWLPFLIFIPLILLGLGAGFEEFG